MRAIANTKEKGGGLIHQKPHQRKEQHQGKLKNIKKRTITRKRIIANATKTPRSFNPSWEEPFNHEHETMKCANTSNNKTRGININFHKTWGNIQLVQNTHPWVRVQLIEIRKKS